MSKFPKVDFNCLKRYYTITLKGIDIFERVDEHLMIGVSVLQYDPEYEKG